MSVYMCVSCSACWISTKLPTIVSTRPTAVINIFMRRIFEKMLKINQLLIKKSPKRKVFLIFYQKSALAILIKCGSKTVRTNTRFSTSSISDFKYLNCRSSPNLITEKAIFPLRAISTEFRNEF